MHALKKLSLTSFVLLLMLLSSFVWMPQHAKAAPADASTCPISGQVEATSGDATSCACPSGESPYPAGADPSKQICQDSAEQTSCTGYQNCDIVKDYVNPFINILSVIAGLVFVISIIIAGIQYTSSGGDPQKVANSRKRLANTIISIFVFLFLYSFLQFLVPGGIFNR